MDAPGATALLDAEVAELCALPYSYWQTALNTTYEKHVTESAPGRRTYRLTVSVIERMSGSQDILVTLTLRRLWGVNRFRRSLVIGPTGFVIRSRTTAPAVPIGRRPGLEQ